MGDGRAEQQVTDVVAPRAGRAFEEEANQPPLGGLP